MPTVFRAWTMALDVCHGPNGGFLYMYILNIYPETYMYMYREAELGDAYLPRLLE